MEFNAFVKLEKKEKDKEKNSRLETKKGKEKNRYL